MLRLTRFSYDKLFKLLEERKKNDWQFAFEIGSEPDVLQRMSHNRSVPMSVLNRICDTLGVGLNDIMEHEELKFPKGIRFCDFLKEPGYWDDLEDICLLEIRFVHHEYNEVDKIEDLRFIIENLNLSIDEILAQVASNIELNPDTNKYAGWMVTDRTLTTVNALCGPAIPAVVIDDGIPGYVVRVGYILTIDVTDPRVIKEEESDD